MVDRSCLNLFETAPSKVNSAIGVISCGKAKKNGSHIASYLYTGTFTRAAMGWCSSIFERWVILSAKYGLLKPEDRVLSYKYGLLDMSNSEKREWGAWVRSQLLLEADRFVFVGKQVYWDWIECVSLLPTRSRLSHSVCEIIRDMTACSYGYPSICAFLNSHGIEPREITYRRQILASKSTRPRYLYNYEPFRANPMPAVFPLASVKDSYQKTSWLIRNRDWRPE